MTREEEEQCITDAIARADRMRPYVRHAGDNMETYRQKLTHCPYCNAEVDAATPAEEGPGPEEGNVSICLACGEWLVFNADLSLRKPTDDELLDIGLSATCRRVRDIWSRMKDEKKLG